MIRSITLFLILTIGNVGFAQEEWNLENCVNYAITNSIDVYQAGISMKDAQILTKMSRDQRYPSLNFNSNANWNFGRTVDPTSDQFVTASFFSNGYSFSTGVSVFEGGRIKYSIMQNEWLEKVAAGDKDAMINLLTLDVIRAYFEILFAEDNYDNSGIQLKTINDQIEQMKKLVAAGSRAQFEIYDLEAQQATFEQDLTIAQNRIDLGYLNLKDLLNLPSDFDIKVVSPPLDQEVYTNIDLVTLDDAFTKALDFQPQARVLDYRIGSAEMGVKVAESAFFPRVTFGASLITNFSNQAKEIDGFENVPVTSNVLIDDVPAMITLEQQIATFKNSPYFSQIDNNFSYGFGVNISVPIYNNYTAKGNRERAKLNLENLLSEKEKNRIQLKNSMMQLLTDAKAARRSLEAARKTMKAREVAFENAEKRFNLGAINSYDYINIQDQLNTSKINFIIARYDFLLKSKILDYFQGYPVILK